MIYYAISNTFQYDKIICWDAGPDYALSMGWEVIKINEIANLQDSEVVVIDNRIEETECENLLKVVEKLINRSFFFKIVDPYFENCYCHYYCLLLVKASHYQNTRFISPYHPTEFSKLIYNLVGAKRFITIPYPYNQEREVSLNKKKRESRIIISGAQNKHIYPYRHAVWLKTRRHLTRVFTKVLRHPGYPDMGAMPAHDLTGIKYIQYLSGFKLMLVSPSRAGLEFLKYNECAYAGCLPVGIPPDTYPEQIKELFFYVDPGKLTTSLLRLLILPDKQIQERVQAFRNFLRQTRSPEVLNQTFLDFIEANKH